MINLIPNKEKKIMIKDFYHRLVTVIFLELSFIVLIASIALLPSFFVSSVKKDPVDKKLDTETVEKISAIDEQVLLTVSTLDDQLSLIEKAEQNKFIVSERIINEILLSKTSSIKITQISFENNEANGKQVSIRGIAPNREKLTIFRRALEANPAFKDVDLPTSNFIKESNIKFFLTLTPS